MSRCKMCGTDLPEGQSICSMCYGDMDHGADGHYRKWAETQREEDEWRRAVEEVETLDEEGA